MHLVVLYGFLGPESSAERLQLTDQLFTAFGVSLLWLPEDSLVS